MGVDGVMAEIAIAGFFLALVVLGAMACINWALMRLNVHLSMRVRRQREHIDKMGGCGLFVAILALMAVLSMPAVASKPDPVPDGKDRLYRIEWKAADKAAHRIIFRLAWSSPTSDQFFVSQHVIWVEGGGGVPADGQPNNPAILFAVGPPSAPPPPYLKSPEAGLNQALELNPWHCDTGHHLVWLQLTEYGDTDRYYDGGSVNIDWANPPLSDAEAKAAGYGDNAGDGDDGWMLMDDYNPGAFGTPGRDLPGSTTGSTGSSNTGGATTGTTGANNGPPWLNTPPPVGDDPGQAQCTDGASGYPILQLPANPFLWPLKIISHLAKVSIWLFVPQQCVIDGFKNRLAHFTTSGILGVPSDLRYDFLGAISNNPNTIGLYTFHTPADWYDASDYDVTQRVATGRIIPRLGSHGMRESPAAMWKRENTLDHDGRARPHASGDPVFSPPTGLPSLTNSLVDHLDLTPLIPAIRILRLCLFVVVWAGFIIRLVKVAESFVGLSNKWSAADTGGSQ